ncbi:hypothetical protein [Leptothoe kymatousa]|nr:hypothetical protein [Leptothoe kymatousa]
MAVIVHWVSTETGPARILIILQSKILEGEHSANLTIAIFVIPALVGAWLISKAWRRFFRRFGVYDRPTTNVGFEQPNVGFEPTSIGFDQPNTPAYSSQAMANERDSHSMG